MKDLINTILRTYDQGVIDQNFKGEYFSDKLGLYIAILIGISVLAYLIGSLNFGIIISKSHGYDVNNSEETAEIIRDKKEGITIFVCDAIKAIICCIIGIVLVGSMGGFVAGFFCIVGHAFPVFFKFRGGKGISCAAGAILITSPLCFVVLLAIYLVLLFGFKMVSFASVMSIIVYPFLLSSINGYGLQIIVALASSALIIVLHRENIARIFNHEEPKIKIGKNKKKNLQNKEDTDENS